MPPTARKSSTTKKAAATPKAPAKKRTPRKATPTPVAGAQGIAAKRAQVRGEDGVEHDPYAPTAWGVSTPQGTLEDLTLPSGQRCLAQRPSPEGLMVAGLLDDLDLVATALPQVTGGKGKGITPSQAQSPAMLKQTLILVDRIAVHVVVKPEITPEPADPADKEIGKIYPSSIDIEDRMFLLNWAVGGSKDIARFREELQSRMADLDSGEDLEGAPV